MGSISALLGRGASADAAALERMAAATPHRGDEVTTARRGDCLLSTRSRGEAPDGWIAVEERIVVGFSGILDNRAALAGEWLNGGGHEKEPGPAAIVAAGIRRLGVERAASRLRGVFAVVASDGHRLWAFRDQLGQHPLFYRERSGTLLVAAEPKAVVAGSGVPAEPDFDVVTRIFHGVGTEMRCAIAGVRILPCSTVLEATSEGLSLRRYWDPESLLETIRVGPEELHERFQQLMTQAVDRCLAGNDAISLSGGVDSPAIAAFAAPLARARSGRPLDALSALYPDHPTVDETRYIEAVAEELGLTLHTYFPEAKPTDDLERWVQLLDGPVPIVAFSQVAEFLQVAKDLGFRNVLSGEVEEFVFEMRVRAYSHLVRRGRIGAAWQHARMRRRQGTSRTALIRRTIAALLPTRARSLVRRPPHRLRRTVPWLTEESARLRPPLPPRSWSRDQVSVFEGSGITLLADDMIHEYMGVRERRPFADIDLWEFALGLRAEVKHGDPGPKALLRELLRGTVPDVILDRRDKTVFDAYIRESVDYPTLRRWLLDPAGPPIPGVDYDLLADRLRSESMTLHEYMWAKDLAGVHVFFSQWEKERRRRVAG